MAILKRKIGGAWVEVTRDFPTPIPVEITQTDVQIATGTETLSSVGTGSAEFTINIGFVPDLIVLGPLTGFGVNYTGCLTNRETFSYCSITDDRLDSGRGGTLDIHGTRADTTVTLGINGYDWSLNRVSVNGLTLPWTAIKYT